MTNDPLSPMLPVGRVVAHELPPDVVREAAAAGAADALSVSLVALRFALQALLNAPALLGLPTEQGLRTEACDLRERVIAATMLVSSAIDAVERDGAALVQGLKAMLNIA